MEAAEVDVKEPTEAGVGLVSGSTSAEVDVKQSVVKRLVKIEADEPPSGGVKGSPTPVAEKLEEIPCTRSNVSAKIIICCRSQQGPACQYSAVATLCTLA